MFWNYPSLSSLYIIYCPPPNAIYIVTLVWYLPTPTSRNPPSKHPTTPPIHSPISPTFDKFPFHTPNSAPWDASILRTCRERQIDRAFGTEMQERLCGGPIRDRGRGECCML
mmetsp:Transcript_22419/g.48749  ORF Transcript_22419/g.48749 Transcript_22419/m.48749 type:complete len:112 (+) Transcript_22419:207-542(+)